jgi:hypothetical protein
VHFHSAKDFGRVSHEISRYGSHPELFQQSQLANLCGEPLELVVVNLGVRLRSGHDGPLKRSSVRTHSVLSLDNRQISTGSDLS